METTLTWIHDFLDVILSNFNMAWLLLIVIILYHKQIRNLLERVTKIGFRAGYIHFHVKRLSDDLKETIKSHNTEDREIPSVDAGGKPGEALVTSSVDDEILRLIANNNLLIGFYYENGSNETIARMYKFFEEELAKTYSVDFKHPGQAEKTIKENDTEVYRIFRKLKEVYAVTIEHDTEDLWQLEDVINYSFLIRIAFNKI